MTPKGLKDGQIRWYPTPPPMGAQESNAQIIRRLVDEREELIAARRELLKTQARLIAQRDRWHSRWQTAYGLMLLAILAGGVGWILYFITAWEG